MPVFTWLMRRVAVCVVVRVVMTHGVCLLVRLLLVRSLAFVLVVFEAVIAILTITTVGGEAIKLCPPECRWMIVW